MDIELCNDILIKTKDRRLLRFSYDDKYGIYYEEINKKETKKNIVYKESFRYFYVTEDTNRNVNVICQDIRGDIIICIFMDGSWKYKTLFYIKYNFITPINVKGFFLERNLKIIYYLDSDSKNLYLNDSSNNYSTVIYSENNGLDIRFNIVQENNKVFVILNSTSYGIYKLILKEFSINDKDFVRDKIIYISKNQYIDYSYSISKNEIHFLMIVNEDKKNSIIYKKINVADGEKFYEDSILFENEKIASCLIIELNEFLCALWISENKLYCCYSLSSGEDFSKPFIYMDLGEIFIKKIELIEENKNKEIYVMESNGDINLFLEDLIEDRHTLDIDYKEIAYSSTQNSELNSANEEIKNLKEIVNKQRSQILNLEYKLYSEKGPLIK
ncbi:hypothetical protein ACQPUY_11310 [Clostridium nigeriense]|uniref:hypothetical protein n=1 Tax=Clostridium nigeriense TaxID=1805470 RepID=UPI003D34197F